MENKAYLLQLFQKYRDNRCSPDEVKQLLAYFRKDSEQQEQLMALVLDQLQQQPTAGELDNDKLDTIMDDAYQNIQQQLHYPYTAIQNTAWLMWKKIAAAAIVFIALGLGTYFYFANHTGTNNQQQTTNNDIPPGGNRAILTLADGRKITLDDAANGELADESGIRITKTEDGQLVYEILRHAPQARASDKRQPKAGVADWRPESVRDDPATYNTIQTPRGGQYKIILPDGSIVWLNSASSLRYPTRFAGAERRVELTGEAYFQISSKYQDASIKTANAQASSPSNGARSLSDYWRMSRVPFIVATATQEVQVLGTQFNINAYTDEPAVKTTLIEGSVAVRVASTSVQSTDKQINPPVVGHGQSTNKPTSQSTNKPTNQSTTLRPGQQARLGDGNMSVHEVDTTDYTAWKDGLIVLNSADLTTLVRQLERWYDVSFDMPATLPTGKVYVQLRRDVNLSEVLGTLEKTHGLTFEIKGRRVMVHR